MPRLPDSSSLMRTGGLDITMARVVFSPLIMCNGMVDLLAGYLTRPSVMVSSLWKKGLDRWVVVKEPSKRS